MTTEPSRLAVLVYADGVWYASQPIMDAVSIIDQPGPLMESISALFSGPDAGHDVQEAAAMQATLRDLGLIVDHDAEYPWCAVANGDLFDVGRYLAARGAVSHADYAQHTVYLDDADTMRRYLAAEPAPDPYKCYPPIARHILPHPAACQAMSSIARLAHLLFFPFGRQRDVTFLDLLPVVQKSVPSKGARHPLEAYVLAQGDAAAIAEGLYHYNVREHALDLVCSGTAAGEQRPSGLTLLLTVMFERVQWRYRHSWAYKDLFYDLGHVTATLRDTAAALGVRLTQAPIAAFASAPDWTPLIEECVLAFHLELPP